MSEMIERVARAICESQDLDWDAQLSPMTSGSGADDEQEAYRVMARAAIEAMRGLPEEPGPRYIAGEYSRRTQAAMIDDALLSEKPQP